MSSNITIVPMTGPLVNVRVSSNLNAFIAEKRFDRTLTIGNLKGRLELITGGCSSSMILDVYDDGDNALFPLSNDNALLGAYHIEENYRIHVTDTSKRIGDFEDTSKIEKFELSQEEYSKRSDSVRSFLQSNKLGKYNEEEQERLQNERLTMEREEEEKANTVNIGDRCEIRVQGEPTRRGQIKFVGKTHFKPGWWVGVQYDEPLGKNDGSVGGQRYFECPDKYGGFVRPANVLNGDFPEIEHDLDEI